MILDDEETEWVIRFLRELSRAEDMPMHHAADIDQFLAERLGVSPDEPDE